jgi:hypothetical protein
MGNAAMAFDVFGVNARGRFVRKSRGVKSLVGRGIWRLATSVGGAELLALGAGDRSVEVAYNRLR